MASLIRLCTIDDCNNAADFDYCYAEIPEQQRMWLAVCDDCINRYKIMTSGHEIVRVAGSWPV